MNDIDLMKNWVRDPKRKFAEGLLLFKKYKANNKYDEFFANASKKPDATTQAILVQKINQMVRKLTVNPTLLERRNAQIAQENKDKTPPPAIGNKGAAENKVTHSDLKDIPVHLHDEFKQIQAIVPKLGGLHAKLKASKDKKEQAALSKEIASLDETKRELWAKIDKATGEEKEDPEAVKKK